MSMHPWGGKIGSRQYKRGGAVIMMRRGEGFGDVIGRIIPFISKLFKGGQKLWARHGDFAKSIGKTVMTKVADERARKAAAAQAAAPQVSPPVTGGSVRSRKGYTRKGRGRSRKRKYIGRRKGGSFISNIQPGPLP